MRDLELELFPAGDVWPRKKFAIWSRGRPGRRASSRIPSEFLNQLGAGCCLPLP